MPTNLPPGFGQVLVASGLMNPTAMEFTPDGRLFVCEEAGKLRVIKNDQLLPTPFLTVKTTDLHERGLVGVTLDPDFENNGYVYVYYTVPDAPVHNRLSRFMANPAHPDVALAGSEKVILELDDVASDQHNGGAIHFGTGGKLYVAVGDDNNGANAQNLGNLFGKILRIHSDGSIPADNPLVGVPGTRPEIWAWGFRNPYTFAVQPGTGRIYVNDVGSGGAQQREEVNLLLKAGNYGWPTYEGYTSVPGFQSPVFAYDPNFGGGNCAIAGGVFYNPTTIQFPTEFVGKYFFADLCGNWVYRLDPNVVEPKTTVTPFATNLTAGLPVDLKIGPGGRLYVLLFGGQVLRIAAFATETTLVSSLSTSHVGQVVTFTAKVGSVDPSLGTPTGEVTFSDRGTALAKVPMNVGVAKFSASALTAGNHSIKATFTPLPHGSVPFSPSKSNVVTQVVRAGESVFAVGGAPGGIELRRVGDGSFLRAFTPYGPGYSGRISVALADINNDGFQDLVTGAQAGNPHLRVYDGKTGFDPSTGLLAEWFAYGLNFNVGANVAAGDINNDGYADVVTGATIGNPDVRAYDGRDIAKGTFTPEGSTLVQFFAYGLNFNIGAHVCAADISGDGYADLLTGASAGNPDIHVYTGRDIEAAGFDTTNSQIASWFSFGLSFNVGVSPSAGDVNGDGYQDVIVGASAGNPHVRIFSGRDLASNIYGSGPPEVLGEFFAYLLHFNVGVSVGVADVDGDGKADILTGASVGAPHFRVVAADSIGVLPPALNGIDAFAASLVGGIHVAA